MYKKYGTEVDITAIARDYVEKFYDNFKDYLWWVDGMNDITKLFPELEDDILDEAMRLITIDYCKKKVAEKEGK